MSNPVVAFISHNGRGQVVIDFQQQLNWVAFSVDQAEQFAQSVLARVALLRGGAIGTPPPARREVFEEVIRMVDAVRNDHTVPLDDESDAVRRLADRRRLAALTQEEKLRGFEYQAKSA
jgi:hypothetical protein